MRAIFTERVDGAFALRRGFALEAGERVAVVEDVVTTGKSTREVLDVLRKSGAVPVVCGSIVDRRALAVGGVDGRDLAAGRAGRPKSTASRTAPSSRSRSPPGTPPRAPCAPAASPSSRPARGTSRSAHEPGTRLHPRRAPVPRSPAGRPIDFGGIALAIGDDPVAEVVASGAAALGRAKADGASPELGWVPLAGSSACRFALDLTVARGAPIDLSVRFASGAVRPRSATTCRSPSASAARLGALAARLAAFPGPPPTSSPRRRAEATSRLPPIQSRVLPRDGALLRAAGGDAARVRSVLDIGCGTGRLLVGWHVDAPGRRLVGTDLNADLIAWDAREPRAVAAWELNGLRPPLPHPDAAFDSSSCPPSSRTCRSRARAPGSRRSGGSSRRAVARS